ncbi:MAG TPA: 2-isopropylmalate synthase [Thermodesulfobacteriota bacterium]|nr:2-isopropylmalate synthase [Thermodesulfobacteriota bacterium]
MRQKCLEEDKWWVSPYNFIDEVRAEFSLPERVEIHDATLRDGEQTPGVVFRKEDKIRIAQMLDETGIERIEAGMPAVSDEDFEAIKEISKLGLKARIFTFARAMNADIDKAIECGAHGVVIEIPLGYPKLKYQFKWTWEDVVRKSFECINYAKKKKLHVVYFPYDTTRARDEDLTNVLTRIMRDSPPDSVGLVDTMGCALPEAIKYLVRKIKKITNLPVEIHTHNDFGMAVATELAAVAAGAEVVHGCVNGLGERTGNAAVEELMVGLHILLGLETGYRLDRIGQLCRLVRDLSGIHPAGNKPVIGEENYTRESGIGVDLVVKNPLAMFGTAPQLFGREGKVVLGKKSGKASITYTLDRLGIQGVSDDAVTDILKEVKARGTQKRALLSVDEFKEIVSRRLK